MFKNDETREKVRKMLLNGDRQKDIVAATVGECLKTDINNLAFKMRQSGELKPVTTGQGKKKDPAFKKNTLKKKVKKAKELRDEFEELVEKEILRVEHEIVRLGNLAVAYDKTMPDFAEKVETKITAEKKRLAALKDYQNN